MRPDQPTAASARSVGSLGAALALFGFVFCARAWLIKAWGSPVPYWDQWDAEAAKLFIPWFNGTLRWVDLLAPHNEHRIALTRIADLALFLTNGRWNLWWELLFNAALHAATAAVLARIFWSRLNGASRGLWLLGLAVLFIAPSGWQNALWGFQSQFYFESLLSVLAIAGLLGSEPGQSRFWLGWVASFLALFALGSGMLAAVAVLIVRTFSMCLGLPAEKPCFRRTGSALLAVSVVAMLGWALRAEVPGHAYLHAHSAGRFLAVFARGLAWPWVDSGWLWVVMQAPVLLLLGRLMYHRRAPDTGEGMALGLGLLAGLHAAAIAYSRGGGLPAQSPLSRYQDALLLGVAANCFLLLRLASTHRAGRIAALLWTGTLLAGLLTLTTNNLSIHLPFKRAQDAARLAQIRDYLVTHEVSVFTRDANAANLIYPDASLLKRLLDDPRLHDALPSELSDSSTPLPWLIACSPWLVMLSGSWLFLVVIRCARPKKA